METVEQDRPAVPPPTRPARSAPSGRGRSRDVRSGVLLLVPALAALAVFFGFPLVRLTLRSFTDPEPGLGNYTALFTDGVTIDVLFRTLLVGLVVTVCTLLLAYPFTYVMCHTTPTMRALMFTVVLIPFWTSMLARNYAWYILFQQGGIIQRAFSAIGIDDVVLLGTTRAVTVVMVGVLLPFMVLPLYSVMSQIDPRLMIAGQNLGASRIASFRQIYLPLSAPGMIAGASLVFILTLGFFLTPALIGSPQEALIAQLMAIKTQKLLDFGGAGAMGILILVVTLLVLWLGQKLSGRGFTSLASGGRVEKPVEQDPGELAAPVKSGPS